MNENLTLEERERHAYITNSPEHELIVLAMGGDEELQERIAELEREIENGDALNVQQVDDLEKDLEEAETKLAKAEDQIADLEHRIHISGVDLVE